MHDAPRHTIHLPAPLVIAKTAAAHLVEATIAPLAIFYLVMSQLGLHWALIAALAWSYASLIRRIVLGQRLPGLLLMAAGLFTVRTVVALATGSTFIYFLQPTLGTFVVAGLFLFSVRIGQPLAERLAHDFCPLPESLLKIATVRRFFLRISLLWAFIYVVNGLTTLLLLLRSSLGTFMVMRTVSSSALTACAIVLSYLWFVRSLRDEGVALRWARSRS